MEKENVTEDKMINIKYINTEKFEKAKEEELRNDITNHINSIKNDKFKKALISFIRFMLRYGIEALFIVLALILSIVLPKNFYIEGEMYNIKNAIFSIGIFFVLLETCALTADYYIIQWCIKNKITKH